MNRLQTRGNQGLLDVLCNLKTLLLPVFTGADRESDFVTALGLAPHNLSKSKENSQK